MSVDVAGLADIVAGPLALRVYLRHCYLPADGAPPDPLRVNAAVASRWRTDDGTLYTAEDHVTVWAELCRYHPDAISAADPTGGVGLTAGNIGHYAPQILGGAVPTRALFSVALALDAVADLTQAHAREILTACGVEDPAADLLADDYGSCPHIAQAGRDLGWQAVRAPSAARVGGIVLAVFHDAWPPRSRFELVAQAARPTVADAYVTRYKTGKRPAWL